MSKLDELLDKHNQRPSTSCPPVVNTTDTSGEGIETSQSRRRFHSERTVKMKKSYETDDLSGFFVTGPSGASNKLCEMYSRICQKGYICTDRRQFRAFTAFSRDRAFCERSTPPPWDSWIAYPWFWRLSSDRRRAREALRQMSKGSLSCSGQRVPVSRRLDSECFWKRWASICTAGESFFTPWCASRGWELWTGRKSLRAVCPDGQPSTCHRCLVAQWGFG